MSCKYLSKALNGKIKCKYYKMYIDYNVDCKNCLNRNFVRNKPIKNKTNKQKQLEKNRYSIFTTNLNKCYYCGKEGKMDLHEVYGGSNRKRSIKNGLVVPLCRKHHQNEEILNELKIETQKMYEVNHTRDEFIKLIGKSYIK